jgi:hypothetical protein
MLQKKIQEKFHFNLVYLPTLPFRQAGPGLEIHDKIYDFHLKGSKVEVIREQGSVADIIAVIKQGATFISTGLFLTVSSSLSPGDTEISIL